MTFFCGSKDNEKECLANAKLTEGNLEKDNGHSLVLVLRKRGTASVKTVHKKCGTTLLKGCWWNSQKADVQFSALRAHSIVETCEEYESPHERTGRPVVMGQSSSSLVLSVIKTKFPLDCHDPADQDLLLQQHGERIAKLWQQDKLSIFFKKMQDFWVLLKMDSTLLFFTMGVDLSFGVATDPFQRVPVLQRVIANNSIQQHIVCVSLSLLSSVSVCFLFSCLCFGGRSRVAGAWLRSACVFVSSCSFFLLFFCWCSLSLCVVSCVLRLVSSRLVVFVCSWMEWNFWICFQTNYRESQGPRLYVCQAPNAFICVSGLAPPKHQMRLYVCHQMRLYVCHQMRLYVCHQMRLYVCHQMRLYVCHQMCLLTQRCSLRSLTFARFARTFFNSLN